MLISVEHGSTRSKKQEVTADIPTCRIHLGLTFRLHYLHHIKLCLCMFTDQEQKQFSLSKLHPLVVTM